MRRVGIEVYSEGDAEAADDPWGVFSEHRPDLPKPSDGALQEWVRETFDTLEPGATILNAGEMVYEPNGEIVRFEAAAEQ